MLSFEDLTNEKKTNGIKSGDVLFVEGNGSIISRMMNFFLGSNFTHTAMLVKIDKSWFVLETRPRHSFNYQMMPANWWFQRHPNRKTYLGKMPKEPGNKANEELVKDIALNPAESIRPYQSSFIISLQALKKWLGLGRNRIKTHIRKKAKPIICSTLITEAWERAGIIKKEDHYTFPGDIVDIIGGKDALIPLDYSSPSSSSTIKTQTNNCNEFQELALNI